MTHTNGPDMEELIEKAKTCLHDEIETLYQYDKQKNRTNLWACPECRIQFAPVGLVEAINADLLKELRNNSAAAHVMAKHKWTYFYCEEQLCKDAKAAIAKATGKSE